MSTPSPRAVLLSLKPREKLRLACACYPACVVFSTRDGSLVNPLGGYWVREGRFLGQRYQRRRPLCTLRPASRT